MGYQINPPTTEALRQMAIQRFGVPVESDRSALTAGQVQQLLEEMSVRKIEVEIQNEYLQETCNRLDTALSEATDLYDCAPIGCISTDMAGKIKKLNFAGASLLGQERHLLMSRSFADFLPLEQRGHVQALMHQVTYSGDDQQCNVQLHTSIDQVKDVMVVMSPLARGQGYMLLLTDITAHQPLEDDLFQTQGYLQAIFESLPQYLAVLDEEAKVIQTNALWNTYALSTGHAYRNGFANAYYADLIDGVTGGVQQTNSAVMAGVVDVISGKAPSFQLEYTFQSGVERRYFVMHVIAVRDGRARAVVSHQELSRYKTEYVQRVTHTARHRAA